MTATAQSAGTADPGVAPETEVVTSDPIAEAAQAFKSYNPDAPETPDVARDEQGRFAPKQIEAEDEAEPEGDAEAEAESHDEEDADEAAEEAQPEAVDLPTSWPAEQAEMWKALPPETQAFIAEREGQRDAAVNAKFQEAANVKKANEALVTEAQANRQRFAEAADYVLSLVAPQKPSPTMLNPQSSDYNPDAYHLALAQYDQQAETLQTLAQQRQAIAAQQEQEAEAERQQRIAQINETAMPSLVKHVPAFAEGGQAAQDAFMGLARYALENGVPQETRLEDFTAVELTLLAKARKYDEMEAAKAKVQPKAAKPAAPPVKPGVTTPRAAVETAQRKKAFERLEREGTVEAAAAIFKLQSKGLR